ncbi:MAG: argininosuccinate lyase [Limnochordia bacterium]|nr:argininosuccinate lyase [Limnochordia bacterium]
MRNDHTHFPAQVYKESVLTPLFNDFKQHFYEELMDINYAHCVMLAEQKIISLEEAKRILAGLREIEATIDLASLEYTGEYEDIFFFIESELINKIGLDVAGKLHTGRSRNDIDITLYKMKIKGYLHGLIGNLADLVGSLLEVAQKHKATLVVAYTHGQPAQPTTFGHYLGSIIEILERDLERLFQAYRMCDKSSMGAAAITTTGFSIDRHRVADLLGFREPQENSYGCIAAVDYLTQVYSALKILFISLGRVTQDLGYWTGFEVAHLYVPNEFVQISSIMPQKRNPVPIEHLRIMASIVNGHCDTVINAMHNTPFTDMNDAEDPIQVVGFAAFSTAERMLRLFTELVKGLSVNEEKVQEHLAASFASVTELADSLVRAEGISFRQAHEIASAVTKELLEEGKILTDLEYERFRRIYATVMQREPQISMDQLSEYVKPDYFVAVRECFGGPGVNHLTRSLLRYEEQLDYYREELKGLLAQTALAEARLKEAVDSCLQYLA